MIQFQPDSSIQLSEQPSVEEAKMSFSHYSFKVIYPSPHYSEHVQAVFKSPPRQCQPLISSVQFAKQPILSKIFPSSQTSVPTFFPSPHIGVHVVVSPVEEYVFEQVHPLSKEQKAEQPS